MATVDDINELQVSVLDGRGPCWMYHCSNPRSQHARALQGQINKLRKTLHLSRTNAPVLAKNHVHAHPHLWNGEESSETGAELVPLGSNGGGGGADADLTLSPLNGGGARNQGGGEGATR